MPLIGFVFVLVLLGAGTAALLRRAGMNRTGARSFGGVLAGLLMSPGILGAIDAERYRTFVLGGVEEHRALVQVARRHGADRVAAEHARIDFEQRDTLEREQQRELATAQQTMSRAEFRHQRAMIVITGVFIGAVLLGSGLSSIRDDRRSGWPTAVSVGLWGAAVPGAAAFAAASWWWDCTPAMSATFAAGFAIGAWALTRLEATVADEVEVGGARLIQDAGRIASSLAIALAIGVGIWQVERSLWAYLALFLTLPIGWMLFGSRYGVPGHERRLLTVFDLWVLPGLAALVTVRTNVAHDFSIWPLLVAVVLSSDGRWLGAALGAMLPGGRTALRTMRLVIPAMAAGPNQLALAGVASICGLLSDSLLLALVGGAALVDLTANTRRRLAFRIGQAESQFDREDVD